ncbi:folylpolyglutamate synthase [Wolbachia endosymbiont of Drosophila ananassae]|nr:folylpolyglutamate synthase [Wolbachia endosymbiont of Drosophila ananassae]
MNRYKVAQMHSVPQHREKANNIGIKAIECESIGDAISNHILKASIQNVKTILICGSLFLARDFAMENS